MAGPPRQPEGHTGRAVRAQGWHQGGAPCPRRPPAPGDRLPHPQAHTAAGPGMPSPQGRLTTTHARRPLLALGVAWGTDLVDLGPLARQQGRT